MSNDIVKTVGKLPVISAEAYAHVGRYAGGVVMAVFEQLGGVTRMASWADENPTDFYTKLFPKMISRSAQLEVTGSISLDDAITRLESGDIVEAEYVEVEKEWDL